MFENLGFFEIVVIVLIVFLFSGPEKIPEIAKKIRSLLLWKRKLEGNIRAQINPLLQELEKPVQNTKSNTVENIPDDNIPDDNIPEKTELDKSKENIKENNEGEIVKQ